MIVQTANLDAMVPQQDGVLNSMRLESEVRRYSTVEQHYLHGRWVIVKVFVRGELTEIAVKHRQEN